MNFGMGVLDTRREFEGGGFVGQSVVDSQVDHWTPDRVRKGSVGHGLGGRGSPEYVRQVGR